MVKRIIKRTEEREFAFKMLYALEFNQEPYHSQIERLDKASQQKATLYVEQLISTYLKFKNELDTLIKKKLENWDLRRVAIVDKVILRMAIVEIIHFDEIPPEVSINEAIELAKKYSTAGSGKFINGLLDAIYKTQRAKMRSKIKKEEMTAD